MSHDASQNMPETATGNSLAAQSPITSKKGYAQRWQGSPRWIDSLLQKGLPHLRIGARRVRILIPEADAWMREQFGTSRRGKLKGDAPKAGNDGK